MRDIFTEQLALLNKEVITMGAICEAAIKKVFEAFTNTSNFSKTALVIDAPYTAINNSNGTTPLPTPSNNNYDEAFSDPNNSALFTAPNQGEKSSKAFDNTSENNKANNNPELFTAPPNPDKINAASSESEKPFSTPIDNSEVRGAPDNKSESATPFTSYEKLQAERIKNEVVPLTSAINEKERTIESLCVKLLLSQQPVARDLRQVTSALKMIADMNRIGEEVEDIAAMLPFVLGKASTVTTLLQEMAYWCTKMITTSVTSFVKLDSSMAEGVLKLDDEVDAFFDKIKYTLIGEISDGRFGDAALDLFMVAKYLERIGDHAQNIAEVVLNLTSSTHEATAVG